MIDAHLAQLKDAAAAAVEMKTLQEECSRVKKKLEDAYRVLQGREAELEATTYYLHSLLNNISQGILFIKLSGIVSTYNPRAEEILGVPQAKVLNSPFSKWFQDDLFSFSMEDALARKKAPESLFMSLCPVPGSQKELEISAKFDLEGGHSNNGLIVFIRDITEIRRLQSIANRHYRMEELGEMAASLAHEIRNPLGGIEGFASLLCRDLQNMPEQQKMAYSIMDGTRSLNRLVSNVLHYARPIKLRFTTTDLVMLSKQVIEIVKADSAYSHGIEYHLACSSPSILAPVDEEVLKTALLNLVVNAVQSMPSGGSLRMEIVQEKEAVSISLTDTGEGIAKENIEKIFSPFFSTKEEGNGLGLSEVQNVIQAHGGAIQVRSELGRGSTFTIKLPLAGK